METFTPPFCPSAACPFHCPAPAWRFKKMGHFTRRHCQPARIQRYQCLHCRRSFSTQTFQFSYWLHAPELTGRIFHGSLACSGLRQMAQELEVSPDTLQRRLARLGRHCLLFNHRHRPEPREALVLDGFESFEFSQFFPFHLNLLVGAGSHYLYGSSDSPLRRKGRMTPGQKRRRAQLEARLGRPDPGALQNGVQELLRRVGGGRGSIVLHSDDHPAYPRAFRQLPGLRIEHHVTSSRERRTASNPLFPVNLADLLIRHAGANHKRETIAYSKRRQEALYRFEIFVAWRNHMRPWSVKRGGPTPAQRAGLRGHRLRLPELLARRLFPGQEELPERLQRVYRREVLTPALGVNRTHRLKYAF